MTTSSVHPRVQAMLDRIATLTPEEVSVLINAYRNISDRGAYEEAIHDLVVDWRGDLPETDERWDIVHLFWDVAPEHTEWVGDGGIGYALLAEWCMATGQYIEDDWYCVLLEPWRAAVGYPPPESMTSRLAADKSESVRYSVATNPATSVEVLTRLSRDNHWWVRYGVARNRSTPADVLTELATDVESGVRLGVALNPNTLVETIASLAEDENTDVQRYAQHNQARS